MSKVKAGLKDKSIIDKIKLGEQRAEALKGNTEIAIPGNVVTAFTNAVRKLKDANDKVSSTQIKLKEMYKLRDKANEIYIRQTEIVMGKINSLLADDRKLLSTGFPISRTGISARNIALELPVNVRVSNTNKEGQILVKWKHVRSAHAYIIHYGADPDFRNKNTNVLNIGMISKIRIDDLASGTKIWVRVKAVKANVKGPWSDPTMCTVI